MSFESEGGFQPYRGDELTKVRVGSPQIRLTGKKSGIDRLTEINGDVGGNVNKLNMCAGHNVARGLSLRAGRARPHGIEGGRLRDMDGGGAEANVVGIRASLKANGMTRGDGINRPEPHRQDGITHQATEGAPLRDAGTSEEGGPDVGAMLEASR
eukprot:12031437-Heterocapsa_arctica.AAC.1